MSATLDALVIALVYLAVRIVGEHINPERGDVTYLDGTIYCTTCRRDIMPDVTTKRWRV